MPVLIIGFSKSIIWLLFREKPISDSFNIFDMAVEQKSRKSPDSAIKNDDSIEWELEGEPQKIKCDSFRIPNQAKQKKYDYRDD